MMSLDDATRERLPERLTRTRVEKALVDAHVHLYPTFDRDSFLRSAISHARSAGAEYPWLLFTETARDHAFRGLSDAPPSGWHVDPQADEQTLTLHAADGGKVRITAGRQVQTGEGLELLALGSDEPIADGTPLAKAMMLAVEHGALPVVPWGFGKWSGRRGKFLAEFLSGGQGSGVFLGDNGGRPWFWPDPEPFKAVAATGRRVLPGSDPLPFKSHEGRAGSYGLIVELPTDPALSFATLAAAFADSSFPVRPFGARAGSLRFVRDQVAMQIVKRARR